ncbi:MAG: hypothetical protein VB875_17900, partial [Pirellulales bacterium]
MTLEPTGKHDGTPNQPEPADGGQSAELKKAAVVKKAVPLKKAGPQKAASLKKAALLESLPGESVAPNKSKPSEMATPSPTARASETPVAGSISTPPAATATDPAYAVDVDEADGAARGLLASWESYSAAAVSMLVHMLFVLILGLWGLNTLKRDSGSITAIAESVVIEDLVEEDASILEEEIIIKEVPEPAEEMDDPITIESPLEDAEDNTNLALLDDNEDVSDLLVNTETSNFLNVPLGNLLDANPSGDGGPK